MLRTDKYRIYIRWNKHKISDFGKSVRNILENLSVQLKGIRTAVTEVNRRDLLDVLLFVAGRDSLINARLWEWSQIFVDPYCFMCKNATLKASQF
jgi:hypothetical protein